MDNKRSLLHAVLIDLPFFVLLAAFLAWSVFRADTEFIQTFYLVGILLLLRSVFRVLRPDSKISFLFLIVITIITTMFALFLSAWYLAGLIPATMFRPDVSGDRKAVFFPWSLLFVFMSALIIRFLELSDMGWSRFILRILFLCLISVLSFLWALGFNRYYRQIYQLDSLLEQASVRSLLERKYNRELRSKNALIEMNARLEERSRMSRDIHNAAGHTITAALMSLEAAQILVDTSPEEAKEKMEVSSARLRETLHSIRQAVHRGDSEESLVAGKTFFERVDGELNRYAKDTGTHIRSNLKDQIPAFTISEERADFLVGAVLELMTNSIRHAGASAFTLLAQSEPYSINLIFEDNGSQNEKNSLSDNFSEGFGLSKIRQTIEHGGGTFDVVRDDGFRVSMRIHLR